jgi:sugar-specific transcriptional regulator TrmB
MSTPELDLLQDEIKSKLAQLMIARDKISKQLPREEDVYEAVLKEMADFICENEHDLYFILNSVKQLQKFKTGSSKRELLQQLSGYFDRTASDDQPVYWESSVDRNYLDQELIKNKTDN